MATIKRTRWQKFRYWLNGLVIVAPLYFLYTSLTPPVPEQSWKQQSIGPFTAVPTPADADPPYQHDGEWVKDFSVTLCEGCLEKIRYAFLSVGARPASMPKGSEGILHGISPTQHVHAPYPPSPSDQDKLWLSVQEWNGTLHHASWPLNRSAPSERKAE